MKEIRSNFRGFDIRHKEDHRDAIAAVAALRLSTEEKHHI
jgi:hypothetical protein